SIIPKIALLFLVIGSISANAQLSPNFYDSTCPDLSNIVRDAVRAAVAAEARMGASLLRLHFHDCFVNGCDGSVLLANTATFTGEQSALPNVNSLRGFNVIDDIKARVESACPGVVSCADIVALAAVEGTVALNGPYWTVGLGRRDSLTASEAAANNDIPTPLLDLNGLISSFANKGFTTAEMVALSGSHTIGQARCTSFRNRIYKETNIDPTFASQRRANCPANGGDNNLAPLDEVTPTAFDGNYYGNLVGQRGLLHSDQQLLNSVATAAQVKSYTTDSQAFFNDFASGMVKMSNLSPLTGSQGEIRRNCARVN
ncbi:peroxidase 3, partial [Genlisea aurea]